MTPPLPVQPGPLGLDAKRDDGDDQAPPRAAAVQRFRLQYSRRRADGGVQQVCVRGGVETRHTEHADASNPPSPFDLAARCASRVASPAAAGAGHAELPVPGPINRSPAFEALLQAGDGPDQPGRPTEATIDHWLDWLAESGGEPMQCDAEMVLRHPLFPALEIRLREQQGRCLLVLRSGSGAEVHWLQARQQALADKLAARWQRPVTCVIEADRS